MPASNEERPDPDALLARVQQEEQAALRGKLRIYFGSNAGVGKTCAMLDAAQREVSLGRDVLAGVVETHGRQETADLLNGLEQLPRAHRVHRDFALTEFDLDAALQRHPAVVLVDELAHSNVPGSRHPKRWQDVEELLSAGIDVWTTLNVQHLESLNDLVSGIIGIRVRETVPDHVFDNAHEVVVVDLPPDDLLQRLKDGKVYLAPSRARFAALFPQGQPVGPAGTGPAPHRRPGRHADARVPPRTVDQDPVARPRAITGRRGR
ncbi:hypothetical protein P0D92_16385 [Pseudomonas sp. CBSPAW29]|nr:hypothetical protein P0D92_16385 [Pseudomonas sp. CBSPAW29]